MNREQIENILSKIVHPDTGKDIVSENMVDNIIVGDDKIQFTLIFEKARDPWMVSIKRNCEQAIRNSIPDFKGAISIFIKEGTTKKTPKPEKPKSFAEGIKNIIAISSAKGGVGKSTVTANLAVALSKLGYSVGVLDSDIYGPSQPTMFGVENYEPGVEIVDGIEMIIPAENYGVKMMSIGFFINPNDALIWRGPMANNALKQMIHQTGWGELDFLLIDLPPGTGDVHLSVISELKIDGAVIVGTPQKIALADVVRGIEMFKNKNINIPLLGVIENMAWFTPAELPDNKYYIFGKGGVKELAEKENLPLLGEIPLILSVRESADNGSPIALQDNASGIIYKNIAEKMVSELAKTSK